MNKNRMVVSGRAFDLTAEQLSIIESILSGGNHFITGPGGTGKSVLIRNLVDRLKQEGKNVMICAPTGIAAQNIDGITLHSAFNLNVGVQLTESHNKIITHTTPEMRHVDAVIIDEISMVRLDMMDAIYNSLKKVRGMGREIQLIVVGDFHQLPPVLTDNTGERGFLEKYYGRVLNEPYAFLAPSWKSFGFIYHRLTKIMRQDDSSYAELLNRIRIGNATQEDIDIINGRVSDIFPEDFPWIVPYNAEAERINRNELSMLMTEEYIFRTTTTDGLPESDRVEIPDDLTLKIGARVMFTLNDPSGGYTNGLMGTVKQILGNRVLVNTDRNREILVGPTKVCIYHYQNSRGVYKRQSVGSYTQLPLKLAYAVTVHKSQGATYDKVIIDPDNFSFGQLYVALSRVRSLDNLYLTRRIGMEDISVSPLVKAFYDSFHD